MPRRDYYYVSVRVYCNECEEEIDDEYEVISLIEDSFDQTKIRHLINDLIKRHYKDYVTTDPSVFIHSVYRTLSQLKGDKKINIRYL